MMLFCRSDIKIPFSRVFDDAVPFSWSLVTFIWQGRTDRIERVGRESHTREHVRKFWWSCKSAFATQEKLLLRMRCVYFTKIPHVSHISRVEVKREIESVKRIYQYSFNNQILRDVIIIQHYTWLEISFDRNYNWSAKI